MQDIQLDDKKKAQLDGNIKKMLEGGATEDDIMQYASDFKNQFGQKKNLVSSQSFATPSRLPKISEQVSPLQQGANIVGGGVLKEVSRGIPQSIGDGIKKDKTPKNNWLASQWNIFSDMLSSAAAGLTAFQQTRANVNLERAMEMSGESEERKKAIREGFYNRGLEDVVRQKSESILRSPKSTKEQEKSMTEYDIWDGVSMSDLGGILNSALPQIANMGLGAITGMANYAAQIADESNEELKKSPEYNKLSESDKLFYMGTQMVTQSIWEKLPIDILTKKTGLANSIKNAITNKVLKQFRERGTKASIKELEAALVSEIGSFSKVAKRIGVNAALGAVLEPTQEAVQAASKEGVKIATNRLKDREIFDEKEIKKNFWKNVGNSAVAALPVGVGFGLGAAKMNNTKKAIREEISKAVGDEGVQKSLAEINTEVERGNLSPQDADVLGGKVKEYAEIAGRIPKEIDPQTKYSIIGGIEQRNEVQAEIDRVKESAQGIDEAFLPEKEAEIKSLEGKLGQVNDYLEGLVSNQGLPDYIQEKDKFFKVTKDGVKTEITKEHFDIAQLVKNNEDKKQKQKVETEIKDFAERMASGEEMKTPEDLQFYENNKEAIEKKLKEKQKEEIVVEEVIQQPVEDKKADIERTLYGTISGSIPLSQALPNGVYINLGNGLFAYADKNEKITAIVDRNNNYLVSKSFWNEKKNKWQLPNQANLNDDANKLGVDETAYIKKYKDAVDSLNAKYDAELKALEEQQIPDENIQQPIEEQPELVEAVRVEQEPELPKGTRVVTLSGMEEGERVKAVEERKKKTTLTEKETLHNDLIDLANRVQKSRGNEKTNLQGQIRQRVRELNAKLGEEIYKYDGVSVRAKVKSKTKGERYLKIKGTTRDTSGRAIKEDAVLLFDRSPEFVQKYEELADSPNITALQVDSGNGVSMTADQIESALQDIADGIPSVQADNLLNALEEGFNRGYFDLRGKDIGQNRVQASVEDFIGVQQEEVGQPMDEDAMVDWLNEIAELPQEEQIEIDNIILEYEQQPQQTDISGKVQSPNAPSKTTSTPSPKPSEEGKGIGSPQKEVNKQPIGEAKPKQEDVEPKSPLEQQYEEASQKKGEKAQQKAKEKLISDNFDGIVAQLMTKNKIKRQC